MLKVVSLFSGIGAFEKALSNCKIPHEIVAFSEVDKYAVQAYTAIHGVDPSKNLGDISKVEAVPDADLITYGFPCQDLSRAGHQLGLEHDGQKTRSGLFFDALRLIKKAQPRYAIAENVKLGHKFEKELKLMLDLLDQAGYNSYYAVLDACDYGLPQKRERLFIVSIRKDLDNKGFEFPEKKPLQKTMLDYLEKSVSPHFYLDNAVLSTKGHTTNKACKLVGKLEGAFKTYRDILRRVYSPKGCCPTLTTSMGGHRQVKILTEDNNVRKLAPREYWRLMGFTDADFNLCSQISNTQLYKLAGNSICVPVLEEIFKKLF